MTQKSVSSSEWLELAVWAKRPSFRTNNLTDVVIIVSCMFPLGALFYWRWRYSWSEVSCKRKQHLTEIYGACEQLVGLGSPMHGCNSRGPAAEAERGPCCGLVWQQQSRTELARGRHREAKAWQSAVPLSTCWVCVLHHHTLYRTSPLSVLCHCLLYKKLMFQAQNLYKKFNS